MTDPEDLIVRAAEAMTRHHRPGGTVRVVHGDEHGLGEISVLLSQSPPEGGALQHRHASTEVYNLYEGRGVYDVGGTEVLRKPATS